MDCFLPSLSCRSFLRKEKLVVAGFPPFPAEVADPNDLEGTPQDLVRRKPTTVGANSLVLVMFFDMRRTGYVDFSFLYFPFIRAERETDAVFRIATK